MSDLRDRIADALYQWTLAAAGGRRLMPRDEAALRENSMARADAVMGVVGPEIAARDGQISDLEQADAGSAAALARVRALHKPHGWPDKQFCKACENPWPCATIRTINGSTSE